MTPTLTSSSIVIPDVVRMHLRDFALRLGLERECIPEPPSHLVVSHSYDPGPEVYTSLFPGAYGSPLQFVQGCVIDDKAMIAFGKLVHPDACITQHHFPASPVNMGVLNIEAMQHVAGLAFAQREERIRPGFRLKPMMEEGAYKSLKPVPMGTPTYAWSWVLPITKRNTLELKFVSVLTNGDEPVYLLAGTGKGIAVSTGAVIRIHPDPLDV
jgi:3-hydroxymyristoyl/3-hydroxydecanoyl-(acyl carrier protein) dehydratase